MKKLLLLSTILIFNYISTSQQNVGIGTPTPTNKLEVISAVTSPTAATIYSSNIATVGSAVYGISHAAGTTGGQGASNIGTEVLWYITKLFTLSVGALSGTATYANSISGKAF